jgi:hypothetical protein
MPLTRRALLRAVPGIATAALATGPARALAQLVAATAPDELDAAPTRTIRCDQPAMTTA